MGKRERLAYFNNPPPSSPGWFVGALVASGASVLTALIVAAHFVVKHW